MSLDERTMTDVTQVRLSLGHLLGHTAYAPAWRAVGESACARCGPRSTYLEIT